MTQEPVLWLMPDGKTVDKWGLQFYGGQTGKPLYAHKREWVGLTDEEVEAYEDWADFQVGCGRQTLFDMVRDIEAKLKEKNI